MLKHAHIKIFTMKGSPKPMKVQLIVEPNGYKTAKQLACWVKICTEFVATLPPK